MLVVFGSSLVLFFLVALESLLGIAVQKALGLLLGKQFRLPAGLAALWCGDAGGAPCSCRVTVCRAARAEVTLWRRLLGLAGEAEAGDSKLHLAVHGVVLRVELVQADDGDAVAAAASAGAGAGVSDGGGEIGRASCRERV